MPSKQSTGRGLEAEENEAVEVVEAPKQQKLFGNKRSQTNTLIMQKPVSTVTEISAKRPSLVKARHNVGVLKLFVQADEEQPSVVPHKRMNVRRNEENDEWSSRAQMYDLVSKMVQSSTVSFLVIVMFNGLSLGLTLLAIHKMFHGSEESAGYSGYD